MPSRHRNRPSSHPEAASGNQATYSLLRGGFGLLLLSAAAMAFEVILTHLFSVLFQYHFAFLAISTAILGLGMGAMLGYRSRSPGRGRMGAWLGRTSAILAITIPLLIILFWLTGFVPGYIVQILLGACPFVMVGLITARLYEFFDNKAAWLYAFDLFGAALGLMGALGLLNLMSAASAGFVLGLTAAMAALVFSLEKQSRLNVSSVALILNVILLAANLVTHLVDLPHVTAANVPPDKTMFQMLTDPASPAKVVDSAWSSFARVDLVEGSDPSQMYAFTNAGAGSYMYRFNGDLSQVSWLKDQVEYLPYLNYTPQKTLILGAGAGKDVLQALLAGSQDITAVEINPAMVAITRRHADYNGGILDYPGVRTMVADGRNYLEHSVSTYDMIYLNLVYAQAPAPGSNALSEAYIFTIPAFQLYWQHLSPDGRLGIVSHQGLEGARALITAIKALTLEGVSAQDALKHSALLRYNANDPNQATTVMILQKKPFTSEEVTALQQAGLAAGMAPLFLTGTYEALFSDLASGKKNVDQFLTQKDYNLFPTTDDSPFFFNLNPGLPQPLLILLGIALAAMLLYLLFMLGTHNQPTVSQLLFFGSLGLGYILIEVPLIQRTLLLAGSPTLAMVVVLASLMVSGGAASYLSSRWGTEKLWMKLSIAAFLVMLMVVILAFLQPKLVTVLEPLPQASRILLAGLSLVPLGFLMGVPFANGLRLAGQLNKRTLPYLWGWNAVTSVAGSALAACVAIWSGFGTGLLLGAAFYLLAAGAAWLQSRSG